MTVPRLRLLDVELYERPTRLRLPFRFGVVTLTEAPQVFVRARVQLEDGREGWGAAAEMLAPKWFDKNPALSNEANFDQLRLALRLASDAYRSDAVLRSAFGLFAAHYQNLLREGRARGLNALVASFGPAELDRAVADALCRLTNLPFVDAVQANVLGIDVSLTPDLAAFDLDAFLHSLQPSQSIEARHTVGLVDVISGHPRQVQDGLPESLEEVVETYGNTWFKVKLGGDIDADVRRLEEIAALLDGTKRDYQVTLDGNEQYGSPAALLTLWRAMQSDAKLSRLVRATVFIEQPIHRARALETDISAISALKPVIIDESDGDLDAFPRAHQRGYEGVSSKCCKGFYKSLLNAARCRLWGDRYFMTGEDLTTQSGLAVQQDLALASLLGLAHLERNGHHYVDGMAAAPQPEQEAFLAAHPDVYERSHGAVRPTIRQGRMEIKSLLECTGFASAAMPDFASLHPSPLPVAGTT